MSLTAERPEPTSPRRPGAARPSPDPAGPSTARGGDPFVAGALLVTAALFTGYQLIAGHVIPPLAVFAVLTAVLGAATIRRRARWLLVLDGLVAVLYLAGSVPFLAANLAHPESPVSFLAEVFLLVILLTVVVGVVLRLRQAGDGARRVVAVAGGAVAGIAVVVSVVAVAGVEADARQDGDVPIAIDRSVFPEQVDAPEGESVLWVANQDPFHHTFVIDDTDVRAVLAASSSVRVPVDLAPGVYRFWCDVPGHEAMEGELHVR